MSTCCVSFEVYLLCVCVVIHRLVGTVSRNSVSLAENTKCFPCKPHDRNPNEFLELPQLKLTWKITKPTLADTEWRTLKHFIKSW